MFDSISRFRKDVPSKIHIEGGQNSEQKPAHTSSTVHNQRERARHTTFTVHFDGGRDYVIPALVQETNERHRALGWAENIIGSEYESLKGAEQLSEKEESVHFLQVSYARLLVGMRAIQYDDGNEFSTVFNEFQKSAEEALETGDLNTYKIGLGKLYASIFGALGAFESKVQSANKLRFEEAPAVCVEIDPLYKAEGEKILSSGGGLSADGNGEAERISEDGAEGNTLGRRNTPSAVTKAEKKKFDSLEKKNAKLKKEKLKREEGLKKIQESLGKSEGELKRTRLKRQAGACTHYIEQRQSKTIEASASASELLSHVDFVARQLQGRGKHKNDPLSQEVQRELIGKMFDAFDCWIALVDDSRKSPLVQAKENFFQQSLALFTDGKWQGFSDLCQKEINQMSSELRSLNDSAKPPIHRDAFVFKKSTKKSEFAKEISNISDEVSRLVYEYGESTSRDELYSSLKERQLDILKLYDEIYKRTAGKVKKERVDELRSEFKKNSNEYLKKVLKVAFSELCNRHAETVIQVV
jgi:hypothetical protein